MSSHLGVNLGNLPCSAQKVSLCESQPFSYPQRIYVVSSSSILKPNFGSGSFLITQSGYDILALYRLLTNYVGNLHKVWWKRSQLVYHYIKETMHPCVSSYLIKLLLKTTYSLCINVLYS